MGFYDISNLAFSFLLCVALLDDAPIVNMLSRKKFYGGLVLAFAAVISIVLVRGMAFYVRDVSEQQAYVMATAEEEVNDELTEMEK